MQVQTLESQADIASATASPALTFRSDVQGIRALAIILVVACHASLPGFAGGFVGVDMFFVISGYLITGLLLREAAANDGRIDLLRFYARRCKRLVPAFLLVTGFTLLLARIALAPVEQIEQGRAATWVSLWLGNVHFSLADLDYFAPEAANNLFLHTWSLGVEEQFYLVWPFLIGALYTQYRHAKAEEGSVWRQLRLGMLIILGTSIALCLYWSFKAPRMGFYMMPSRAWQFAMGGLVFLASQESGDIRVHEALKRLKAPLGFIGLAAIALAVMLLDDSVTYPGFYALIPTVATALLLFSGSAERMTPVARMLSVPGLQWIGNISYSWYLWHWPVLILGALLFGADSGQALRVVLIVVSLTLAAITYYTVESPIRNSAGLADRPRLTLCLALAGVVAMAVGAQWLDSRANQDALSAEQVPFLRLKNNLPALYQSNCDEWYQSSRVVACVYGNQQAEHTAVLIGDSIGAQWFSALGVPFVEAGWRFVVYTKSACPIVDEPIFYARIMQIYENCALWRDRLPEALASVQADLIFIGSAGAYEYSSQQWESGTSRVLQRLAPLADELFVLGPSARLPFNGPDCLARKSWQPAWLSGLSSCSVSLEKVEHPDATAGLRAAVSQHENTHFLDMNLIVCPDGTCSAGRDGNFVYRDVQHLADVFVSKQSRNLFDLMRASSGQDSEAPWRLLAR